MKSVGKTNRGMVRKNNQDNYLNQTTKSGLHIIAVADGLGGHKAGEVASAFAVEELAQYFSLFGEENIFKHIDDVEACILDINAHIKKISENTPECAGMGTTLTVFITNGRDGVVLHVGDSRAYLINDKIKQVTKDHSLVQFMIDQGQITYEESLTHPQKNIITRAIGTEDGLEIDRYKLNIKSGDTVLLCTDGLTNNLNDGQIFDIIKNNPLEKARDALINAANERGGSDNITVVLLEVGNDRQNTRR